MVSFMGKLKIAKLLVLWVSGLSAGGIFGNLVGGQLSYDGATSGALGGMFIFICLRLWLSETKRNL
jgi:hypothetical protein